MSEPGLFVVSDPHGHEVELRSALQSAGLVDQRGDWSGGSASLWLLGDFFDRGPNGVGIVELVMRLQHQAEDSGGEVGAVLGNHEVLTLGMHTYGEVSAPEPDEGARQVQLMWYYNGGLLDDQLRLNDDHLNWLLSLPAMAVRRGHLLTHSDTMTYLRYGESLDAVNTNIRHALAHGDISDWWTCWQRLTQRHEFTLDDGPELARQLMGRVGGSRIVHGHSIIGDMIDQPPQLVTGPHLYADELVLGIDGGLYAGGPLLVVRLTPEAPDR
jgi:hypothetical protein